MNMQQLEHFLAVANTGSFSRAAEQVHLTQPALSRSIQALESELGAPLIDRRGRRNELTHAGTTVVMHARRIALGISELKRSVAMLGNLEEGHLCIGLGPAPYEMLAAELLSHFAANHPRIKIRLVAGAPEVMLTNLRNREVDAVVIHRRLLPSWEDLQVDLLSPTALGFLCRPDHPLTSSGSLAYKNLKSYPIVASGSGLSPDAVQLLNQQFGRDANFDSLIQYQSDEIACLLELARTGDAVFFGVTAVGQRYIDAAHLVQLKPRPNLSMNSQFAMVTLRGVVEAPALGAARRLIASKFES